MLIKTRLIFFLKNWMSDSNLTKTATEGKQEKGIMDSKKPISGCSSSKLLEKIATESCGVGIGETRFKFFWEVFLMRSGFDKPAMEPATGLENCR